VSVSCLVLLQQYSQVLAGCTFKWNRVAGVLGKNYGHPCYCCEIKYTGDLPRIPFISTIVFSCAGQPAIHLVRTNTLSLSLARSLARYDMSAACGSHAGRQPCDGTCCPLQRLPRLLRFLKKGASKRQVPQNSIQPHNTEAVGEAITIYER
jgi:hypothetical protein